MTGDQENTTIPAQRIPYPPRRLSHLADHYFIFLLMPGSITVLKILTGLNRVFVDGNLFLARLIVILIVILIVLCAFVLSMSTCLLGVYVLVGKPWLCPNRWQQAMLRFLPEIVVCNVLVALAIVWISTISYLWGYLAVSTIRAILLHTFG